MTCSYTVKKKVELYTKNGGSWPVIDIRGRIYNSIVWGYCCTRMLKYNY